jgi:hypothetical protein
MYQHTDCDTAFILNKPLEACENCQSRMSLMAKLAAWLSS